MTSTHIHDRYNEVVPGRARSYGPDGDGAWEILIDNTSAVGSSSVFTTARDMARWMANFDRPRVGETVLEEMLTRGVLTTGDTLDYAHGLSVGERGGRRTVAHGGSWRGYRAGFLRFPDEKLSVAVLAAFSTFRSEAVGGAVADIFLDERAAMTSDRAAARSVPARERRSSVAISGNDLEEYEGVYDSDELGTTYTIVLEGDRLLARHRINPEQVLTYLGDDTFVTPGVRGEQTLSFDREGGRVVGYRLAGARFRGIVFERR